MAFKLIDFKVKFDEILENRCDRFKTKGRKVRILKRKSFIQNLNGFVSKKFFVQIFSTKGEKL